MDSTLISYSLLCIVNLYMGINQSELPNRASGEWQITARAAYRCFYTVTSSSASLEGIKPVPI